MSNGDQGTFQTDDLRTSTTVLDNLGGIRHDPQADLACFTSNRTYDRWSVIGIGPPPRPLVGSTTRRVSPVEVFVSFFPPRSETSHLFQSVHLLRGYLVATNRHCLASHGADLTPWCSATPTLAPAWWPVHPSTPHGSVTPLAAASDGVVQTSSYCTGYRFVHTACTDTPSTGFCGWSETHRLRSPAHGSGDNSTRPGESGLRSKLGFGPDRVAL